MVLRSDWPLQDVLRPGEVLVETRAAGINFGELLQLTGQYQERLQPPFVPGNEISGVVRATGENVSRVAPGDAVIALPRGGGWASEVIVPESAIMPLHGPRLGEDDVDFASAASLSITYGTAYLALAHRAKLVAGETVLVTAAAGGVGLAAIEVAKHLGAGHIIAAAGDEAKTALAVQKGADFGLVYDRSEDPKDFREHKLKPLGRGFDVVIDMVGGPLLETFVRSMNFNGRCVVVGFASGHIPAIPANILLVKNVALLGLYWGAHAKYNPKLFESSCADIIDLWRNRTLNPHIGEIFPLVRANDAIAAIQSRRSMGKVVLVP